MHRVQDDDVRGRLKVAISLFEEGKAWHEISMGIQAQISRAGLGKQVCGCAKSIWQCLIGSVVIW